MPINTLRPRQNGRHFADTLKPIFLNENIRISIKISLKFVLKFPYNNIPALVQIMAWRRPGDKPLSEPMMVSSLTHICVTRPQWVKVQHPHQGAEQTTPKVRTNGYIILKLTHANKARAIPNLSRRRLKKTSNLRVTGLRSPVNSPHKGPVTRKIFPCDDVIMGEACDWYDRVLVCGIIGAWLDIKKIISGGRTTAS